MTKSRKSPKHKYPRQFFKNIEDLYSQKIGKFVTYAKRFLANKDVAIDVVHSAFEKSLEYKAKNPKRNFREQIVCWLIIRECKKQNKLYSKEVSEQVAYDDIRDIAKMLDDHDKDREIFLTKPRKDATVPVDYFCPDEDKSV